MKRNKLSNSQKFAKDSRTISSANKSCQNGVNSQNDRSTTDDTSENAKKKKSNEEVLRVSKKSLILTGLFTVGLIGILLSLPLKQPKAVEVDNNRKEAFLNIVSPVILQVDNVRYQLHKGIYVVEIDSDSIVTEIEIDGEALEIPSGVNIDVFKTWGGLVSNHELPNEEAPQGLCAKLIKDYKPKGSEVIYFAGSYIEITDNSKELLGLTEKPEDLSLHFIGMKSKDRFGDSLYIAYNDNIKNPKIYAEQKEIVGFNKGQIVIYDISKINTDTITICERGMVERKVHLLNFEDALDVPIIVKAKIEDEHIEIPRLCVFLISVVFILVSVFLFISGKININIRKVKPIVQDNTNLHTNDNNDEAHGFTSSELSKPSNQNKDGEGLVANDDIATTSCDIIGTNASIVTSENENYKVLYEEVLQRLKQSELVETKFEELQIEHQKLLRDFDEKLSSATNKVEEKANKTIESINNEAEKRIKKAEDEVKKTKSDANKVVEKANERVKLAESKVENIRGELEEKYAEKIDFLEKGKKLAEEKAILAEKKEKQTALNLIHTTQALEGSKHQISVLEKSQEKFLKYLQPSSFASNLTSQIIKLYQLSEEIERTASEFLKIPLEDSYYVFKYLANYEASMSSINKPLFLVETQMASKAQFVFKDSILGTYDLSKPEKDLANDARIYFFSKYLKDFINAIVVLNESFAGLHFIVDDINEEITKPFVDFRKKINDIVETIGITVLSVKVFDRIGNNTDLEADTIDLGIGTTGTILEVKNCIVYLRGNDKPADKIHVIVQE